MTPKTKNEAKIHIFPFQGTLHRKSESLSLNGVGGVDLTAREEEIIFSGIFFHHQTDQELRANSK